MHATLVRSLVTSGCLALFALAAAADGDPAAPVPQGLRAGWAIRDITPERPVPLRGQHYRRISEGVTDPLTVTALALESVRGDVRDQAVMVSCDLITIGPQLVDAVAAEVESRRDEAPDLDPAKVVLNATHTHTGPTVEGTVEDLPPGVMTPSEYRAFAAPRIAEAAVAAWNARRPTEVSWALGHASVARNRRVVFFDPATGLPLPGGTQMYGKTALDNFDSIEGGADTGLGLVCFWNPGGGLAGIVVNVPCPSQEVQNERKVSADFWHDTRAELRKRLGDDVVVFAQCGAGGDCTGRNVWRTAAEDEMLRRRGLTSRQEVARRIGTAVSDLMPIAREGAQAAPEFGHAVRTLDLPQRLVTPAERDRCSADAAAAKTAERRAWHLTVVERFERQQAALEQGKRPTVPIRVNAVRIGDVAIITNPFELFLDYGVRMQARSPATLTCVVQLAGRGTNGTYLPTFRAVEGGGYSAVIESNVVGPEGGRVLVDESVRMLQALWKPQAAMPSKSPPAAPPIPAS
jgi:hypothetical protein